MLNHINISQLFGFITLLIIFIPLSFSALGGQSLLYSISIFLFAISAIVHQMDNKVGRAGYSITPSAQWYVILLVLLTPVLSLSIDYVANTIKYIQYIIWGGALFSLLLLNSRKRLTEFILLSVNFVLWIHVSVFVLQQFLYRYSGQVFDIYNWFFPFAETSISTSYDTIRMGGLTPEPGAYANIVILLASIKVCCEKRVGLLTFIAIITSILTMSASGIFLCALFITSYLVIQKKNFNSFFVVISIIFILVAVFLYSGALEFILVRFIDGSFDDNSTSYKVNNILRYFNSTSLEFIQGVGHANTMKGSLLGYSYVSSNGNAFYFVVAYGLTGWLLLCVLFTQVFRNKYTLPLFLSLLVTRYSVSYPVFWFCLMNYLLFTLPQEEG